MTLRIAFVQVALFMGWALPSSARGDDDDDAVRKAFCKKLMPILKTLERLRKKGRLKPYEQSELAKSSYKIHLDTLWALKDKLRARTVGLSPDEPTYLGYYLTAQEQPSITGIANPYVAVSKGMSTTLTPKSKLAASYELALTARLLKARRKVAPQQLFEMAVKVTDGDIPLAMLTVHNLLKEATYAERAGSSMILGRSPTELGKTAAKHYRKLLGNKTLTLSTAGGGTEFLLQPQALRNKLSDIRPSGHRGGSPADLVSSWYHTFGILFYGSAASSGRVAARTLANVENLTRMLGLGSARAPAKEAANVCAARLVAKMNDAVLGYVDAGIRFKDKLIKIRSRIEAYEWGQKIGRMAKRDPSVSASEIRALVREIYGKYPAGSELREAFRKGYRLGSQ